MAAKSSSRFPESGDAVKAAAVAVQLLHGE
jgi:hypothetical protein